jgi:hypothetical protein
MDVFRALHSRSPSEASGEDDVEMDKLDVGRHNPPRHSPTSDNLPDNLGDGQGRRGPAQFKDLASGPGYRP